MDKEDGSLISSYIDEYDQLSFKTKSTPYSEHAKDFKEYFHEMFPPTAATEIERLTRMGYTVNMEYCAPQFRVIIPHQKRKAVILNIRSISCGSYIPFEELPEILQHTFWEHWVRVHRIESLGCIKTWLEEVVPTQEQIEGYVLQTRCGNHLKIKTEWYVTLHRAKEDITSPKKLFMCVLEETVDDLKVMFKEDDWFQEQITAMEEKVSTLLKETVKKVDTFHNTNSHMDRKEYAILGQQELESYIFSLAMVKYQNQEPDYKAFFKKNVKRFIGDEDGA